LSPGRGSVQILESISVVTLRRRARDLGVFPVVTEFEFLLSLSLDRAIFSGFAGAFWTSLARMAAMTKFELGHACPLMSLSFVVVLPLRG